ncbi:hypothetical protein E1B28_008807 [Marasmius oreades]|uniref:Uncharacterized protein n=1 Tax=Marasmius oreades TaxID=181124 RepID=A0A9P7RZP1_9AGAR|nr:uncharacterized protein E1B28_008807 [Marasmius oreades]KAG7092453.1 hypothetical protein E1B28_008807 [Marasmius oreades]
MEPSASSPPLKRLRLEDDNALEHFLMDVEGGDYDQDFKSVPTGRQKRAIVKPKRFGGEDESPTTTKHDDTTKKKRSKTKRVELSDPESEENFEPDEEDLAQDLGTLHDGDGDDFEDLPKRPSRPKTKSGGREQKAKGKDTTGQPSRKSKQKPQLNVTTSPMVNVVDDSNSPVASTSQDVVVIKETGSSSPPVKKRKLPQIRKNKSSTTGTPIVAIKSAGTVPSKANNMESSDIAKTPILRNGLATTSADLDLRNNNVYAELFGGPGASNMRSGTNKQEQRRKELDKMREEARAKRVTEARGSFALQAQMEKILRFEERFRKSNSPALYPNILGAKMREVHDREKARRGESSRDVPSNEHELEEGEMT